MARVGLRDWVPVAWRVAREFTRPTRTAPSLWPLAVLFLPMALVMTGSGHVNHWDRRAVLGLHRAGYRHVPRALLAAMVVFGAVGAGVTTLMGVVGDAGTDVMAAACVLGVAVSAFGVGRLATVLAGGRPGPLPVVPGPTKAQWVADLAASEPGLDAMSTVFEPHLRQVVPTGEVVTLLAATERLAHRYAKAGFERTTEARRRLFATV